MLSFAALGGSQISADSTSRTEVYLIADDLTGAADAAVAFHDRGIPVTISLAPLLGRDTTGVIASTTESRSRPAMEAVESIRRAFAQALKSGAAIFIKKIDSVLRGNTVAEIAWCANNLPFDLVAVIPSFPQHDRILVEGKLFVDAADADVDLQHALHGYGLICGLIATGEGVEQAVADAVTSGQRTLVFDGASDADLDKAVQAMQLAARERNILWVGSGGLTRALARQMPIVPRNVTDEPLSGKVLFLVGSDHPATCAQVELLEGAIRNLHLNARIVRLDRPMSENAVRDQVGEIGADVSSLLVTGGDTASLVCRAYGSERLEVVGEFEPGLPQMMVRGGVLAGKLLTLKSGGFGDANAFLRLAMRSTVREARPTI